MTTIVQEPNDILRKTANPVDPKDIGSKKLTKIISDMRKELDGESDGVAIAAPQIGVGLRLFVVAKHILKKSQKEKNEDIVFINPEIIRLGRKKEELSEGCLSVRWKYGLVKRSTTATIKALNEAGNEFVMNGTGLLAQIFQHEIDHLNGVLFIDKAKNIEDLPPLKSHGKH